MQQHELQVNPSRQRKQKRVGRGDGSGKGTTCGRGSTGQKARTGHKLRVGFEGGQTPLMMRLPKLRGFTPRHQSTLVGISLATLSNLYPDSGSITIERLQQDGFLKAGQGLKVIGNAASSEFIGKLDITAQRFSAGAKETIQKGGGKLAELASAIAEVKPSEKPAQPEVKTEPKAGSQA